MNTYIFYSYSKEILINQIAALRKYSSGNIIVIEDNPYNNNETPLTNEIDNIRIIASKLDKYHPTDLSRRVVLYKIALEDMKNNPSDYYMMLHMDCYPIAPVIPETLLDGHSMAGISILTQSSQLRFLGPWAIWKEINDNVKVWGEEGNNLAPCWVHTHHISYQSFEKKKRYISPIYSEHD